MTFQDLHNLTYKMWINDSHSINLLKNNKDCLSLIPFIIFIWNQSVNLVNLHRENKNQIRVPKYPRLQNQAADCSYTLVSNECSLTICGFAISLGSLSIQVNGTATSVSVYANTSNTPMANTMKQGLCHPESSKETLTLYF